MKIIPYIHWLIGYMIKMPKLYQLIILLWKKILAKLKAKENLINPLYLNLQLISAMKTATFLSGRMLIQFLTTFLTHSSEFSTPASRYRKYTGHIITNPELQQE